MHVLASFTVVRFLQSQPRFYPAVQSLFALPLFAHPLFAQPLFAQPLFTQPLFALCMRVWTDLAVHACNLRFQSSKVALPVFSVERIFSFFFHFLTLTMQMMLMMGMRWLNFEIISTGFTEILVC